MLKRNLCEKMISIFFIVLILIVSSCAMNPVSGQRELMLLSEEKEIKLGQQTDKQVVEQYGLYNDPALNNYLNDLCKRIGRLSHRPNLNYQCKILDTPVINAFAVPGGYVYFTRGILAHLNDEAELAGVMGHELGHITARHSAQQYSRSQIAQIGLGLAMVLSETAREYQELAQVGVGMLFLRFSRDNERQADSLGVEYSTKAGYDASRMADFFETLERKAPESSRDGLPEWFSTHPSPENRMSAVRQQSKEWQRKLNLKKTRINQAEYLQRLDGMVFGDDPRQGYVEQGIFYHPQLKFQFPVPESWKLENTRTYVRLISPNSDAYIQLTLAQVQSPKEGAQQFINNTRPRVIASNALEVNTMNAYRLVSELKTQQGNLGVLSYFIKKEKYLYVLHGVTSAGNFNNYYNVFDNGMRQFKKLTDKNKLNRQPDRVQIRKVEKSGSLEVVFKNMGIPKKDWENLALVNGRWLKDQVKKGELLKIVKNK